VNAAGSRDAVEQEADWDRLWAEDHETEDLDVELRSLRWRVQKALVEHRYGSFEGLQVIEIGAGRGTNALMYALQGAQATVLDRSVVALEQSRRRFLQHGLEVETVEADLFELPNELRDRFDVSMSFGVCEHFLGHRRQQVVAAHVELVKPGGLSVVNVPNRLSPPYRAWMALAKRRGTWPLGTEVPFSGREISDLAKLAGGVPLRPVYVGGLGTLVNHGLNAVLGRLRISPLPVPQVHVPLLDYLAYDLLQPVVRPKEPSRAVDRPGTPQ
jgi:2-polyprenyl-3-methyl-5-hydroxy-6-metoxy-1,4-benzoquinol methylase